MIQSGGQSVHNPVQQPCKRPEDGSLHCPWIPCQSNRSTRKKKNHLVCPIYARLWLATSHVGLPTHWKGGRGEAGDCPKARVASPVNQFSATSCGARDGAQIAVLQSGGFVTVELWQRRCGSCWTSAAGGITTSSARIWEQIDAVWVFRFYYYYFCKHVALMINGQEAGRPGVFAGWCDWGKNATVPGRTRPVLTRAAQLCLNLLWWMLCGIFDAGPN